MKILKIDETLGHYSLDGVTYKTINEINKEDLLRLVDLALESDVVIDDFNESLIKDPAHQIIYKNISEKIKDLQQKKNDYKDETDRLYLKEYKKYQELPQ